MLIRITVLFNIIIHFHTNGKLQQFPQPPDLFGATFEQQTGGYRASSKVNVVGESQLREAGDEYPPWITERYLQLPEALPPAVRDLADELTAGIETPYEKAQGLENYLRRIPYNLDVPAPPGDRDVVEYFLFELQRG